MSKLMKMLMKYKMGGAQRLSMLNLAVDDLFFNAAEATKLLKVRRRVRASGSLHLRVCHWRRWC